MNTDDIANMVYYVLKEQSLNDYLPSMYVVENNQIRINVLEDVPEEEEDNLQDLILDWAKFCEPDAKEYFVAFKDGPKKFRVVHHLKGEVKEAVYPEKRRKKA